MARRILNVGVGNTIQKAIVDLGWAVNKYLLKNHPQDRCWKNKHIVRLRLVYGKQKTRRKTDERLEILIEKRGERELC